MSDERCPTCGSPVTVASGDGGMSYYVPEVERLRAALVKAVVLAVAGEPDWKVRDAVLDARAALHANEEA